LKIKLKKSLDRFRNFNKKKEKLTITIANRVEPVDRDLDVAIPSNMANPMDVREGKVISPTSTVTPSSPRGNWLNREWGF